MDDSRISGFGEEMLKFQLFLWSFVTILLFLHSKQPGTPCMTEHEWDSEDSGALLKEWSQEDHRHVHVCYLPRKNTSKTSISRFSTVIHSFLRWQLWKAENISQCVLSQEEWSPPSWRNLRGKALLCNLSPKMPRANPLHIHALSHATQRQGQCFGNPGCSRYCAHRTHEHSTETWEQLGALGTVPRKHDAFPRRISRQHGREEGSTSR